MDLLNIKSDYSGSTKYRNVNKKRHMLKANEQCNGNLLKIKVKTVDTTCNS
jgi:hypothetical protein